MKNYYYISTGDLNGFYTLKHCFNEIVYVRSGNYNETGGVESQAVERDWFIKNLSTDRDKAIAAAHAWCDENGVPNTPVRRRFNADFDLDEIHRLKQEQYAAIRAKKSAAIQQLLQDNPEFAGVYQFVQEFQNQPGDRSENLKRFGNHSSRFFTCEDICGKLDKYGSVSEKQLSFSVDLFNRLQAGIARDADLLQERTQLIASGVTAPSGKQTIEGEIVGFKEVDSEWGISTKVIIKLDSGAKVYGTLPSKGGGAQIGDKVSFCATFTVSDKDTLFGFFSRPSKWEFLQAA
jgi:hypothetical protein